MRVTALLAALLATTVLLTAPPAQATPNDLTRLAVVGDSVTTGYGVSAAQSWASRMEARQLGDNILPIGVNGATTRRWLQVNLWRLDPLRTWRPATVMIALGGNEWHMTRPAPEYADHLRQLIGYVRQLVPGARIVLLHYYRINAGFEPTGCDAQPGDPVGCIHAVPPHTWDEYGQAVAQVGGLYGAGYVDVSHTRDWSVLQLPDQAHLTAEGHRLLEADLWAALSAVA